MASIIKILSLCDRHPDRPATHLNVRMFDPASNRPVEIDMCDECGAAYEAFLAPLLEVSRFPAKQATGAASKGASKGLAGPRRRVRSDVDVPNQVVRAWAIEQGMEIKERGAIPRAVMEQYKEAH